MGESEHLIQQEIPHWHTSHVPKAATIIKNRYKNPVKDQWQQREEEGTDTRNSEKITEKLNEIIRYQRRTYDLRSIWQVFVKIDDVLETPPTKGLKAQKRDIENAITKDPRTFEEETWKEGKYIRLKWGGNQEDPQKRYGGKREHIPERRKGKRASKENRGEHHTNE